MSFNIEKSSALEVKLLELHVNGLGVFELSKLTINMVVNGESSAACVPVMGKDTIKSQYASPNALAALTPDMECRVYMRVGDNGNTEGNKSLLFVGRFSGDTLAVNSSPLGSTANVMIQLRHAPISDLGGVSVAQRSYYYTGGTNNPFNFSDLADTLSVDQFSTNTLREGKYAVYLKQLINALFLWYTNGGTNGINVDNILKAVPCVLNHDKASLENVFGSIHESFVNAVTLVFQGAMSSKASLLSILSTLAKFCLFNLVPTTGAFVITPKLNVTRWTDQDIYIGRNRIVGVNIPYFPQRIPVEKVVINYYAGKDYQQPDGENEQNPQENVNWVDRFRWPPMEGGGALLVDPPAILKNVIDVSTQAGDEGVQPIPLNKGGRPSTAVNSVGIKPYRYPWDLDQRIGTLAAKLKWSSLAFSHRTLQVSLIPHWLFSPSFHTSLGTVYEEGTPWGLLGKTVKLRAPYSLAESEKSDDIAYIGYVNEMNLDIIVTDATMRATATITNVRTETEDLWAFPADDNPLYDDIDKQPV